MRPVKPYTKMGSDCPPNRAQSTDAGAVTAVQVVVQQHAVRAHFLSRRQGVGTGGGGANAEAAA